MMKHSLFIWGLLHFVVQFPKALASCMTGKPEQCMAATFVPGYNLVGEGFDIVKLTRKGAYVVDTQTWRRENDTCTLCTNSLLQGKVHKLPLSVVDWRVQAECKQRVSSSLYESNSSLVESIISLITNNWKTGLEMTESEIAKKMVMAGSHSRLAEFSMKKLKQDKYSFASLEFSCKYYRFRLQSNPPPSRTFAHFVRGLPKQYNHESKVRYWQAIDIYGTHYIRDVSLGGKVRDVRAIRSCEASMDGATVNDLKYCLEIEARLSIGETTKSDANYQACQELMKKTRNFKGSFHKTFNDRESEIVGGDVTASLDILFSDRQDASIFNKWTDSLKTNPDIVTCAVEPIHWLAENPQRENLKRAVKEYILEKAFQKNCIDNCPAGSKPSTTDSCICTCYEGNGVNSMCCSSQRGTAKLTVVIRRASGLWGDHFSQADAYVKVIYETHFVQTSVILNNDNPLWEDTFDIGFVTVTEHSLMHIEVWDSDLKYDDLLGSCEERLLSGHHKKICYFTYGRLIFEYSLVCGPHLGGHICHNYVASPN
ncbi:perforin-1-like [Protopterus annectens]|uniref:perforin-1-like n=1 Tax=Protopterus annectens TaxID=7888 RepID=UPI001CF9478D|nr:perforin-1-like [Protopterus annectens]